MRIRAMPGLLWPGIALWAFVALGAVARGGTVPGDVAIRAAVPPLGLFDLLSLAAAVVPWTASVVVVGALLWLVGQRRLAIALLLGDILTELVVLLAKLAVDRGRPVAGLPADLITSASFPSGHVARVAVAVGLVILLALWPWRSARAPAIALGVVLVGLLALARIASGEHWPSDVLGSLLLAGAVVGFGRWAWGAERDPSGRASKSAPFGS
jgi:undecaprenyl-diphosphatase